MWISNSNVNVVNELQIVRYSPNTHTHTCRHTLGADLLLQNELHQNSDLTASPASCPPPPLSLPHSFLVFNPQLSGSLTFLNHHNHTTIYYRCGDANASGTLLPLMVCCFNDIKVNGAWYIANATLTYSPKKNSFSTWGCVWVQCSCEVQENVVKLFLYNLKLAPCNFLLYQVNAHWFCLKSCSSC